MDSSSSHIRHYDPRAERVPRIPDSPPDRSCFCVPLTVFPFEPFSDWYIGNQAFLSYERYILRKGFRTIISCAREVKCPDWLTEEVLARHHIQFIHIMFDDNPDEKICEHLQRSSVYNDLFDGSSCGPMLFVCNEGRNRSVTTALAAMMLMQHREFGNSQCKRVSMLQTVYEGVRRRLRAHHGPQYELRDCFKLQLAQMEDLFFEVDRVDWYSSRTRRATKRRRILVDITEDASRNVKPK